MPQQQAQPSDGLQGSARMSSQQPHRSYRDDETNTDCVSKRPTVEPKVVIAKDVPSLTSVDIGNHIAAIDSTNCDSIGRGCDKNTAKRTSSLPESEERLDSTWTFDTFLEEQKTKDMQHEAQKERTFRRVLTALGGSEIQDTANDFLPPDILRAWETRNEKIMLAEQATREYRRKREVPPGAVLSLAPMRHHILHGMSK